MRDRHPLRSQKTFARILVMYGITCLLLPLLLTAQPTREKGLPFITNYRFQDYNADGVNWWATEDDKGVMYFANATGVLVYDGQQWELIKPRGAAETRSLARGNDGKIYAGTNGDIGFLAPGKNGKLEFVSLKDKVPEQHRVFAEVWETLTDRNNVYFLAGNKMFIWDYKSIRVLESKEGFHDGAEVNGRFYVRIWTRGLTELRGDSFYVVPNGEKFANERIYAMLRYDEKRMLVGTRTQGLFLYDGKEFTRFKTEADPYIVNTSLYGGLVLSNGLFAINTFNNGIVIIDRQGKLMQRIDKSVGIRDNSVDFLFEDSRGTLWMPLFNGIAKFDLRSALTYYDESYGLPAKTVFSVGYYNDEVYAGTNNGVYRLDNGSNRFEFVEGTGGQIFSLFNNGKDFLVGGAEKGLQKIVNGKAQAVIPGINYDFHVRQIMRSKIDTTVFYIDLRSGLAIVRYDPSSGDYAVESFRENLFSTIGFFTETSNGDLWIIGDNPGELKLVKPKRTTDGKLSLTAATVEVYNYKHGLPTKSPIIFEYDGVTYFTSAKDSIFVFNENQNRFIRDTSSFLKNHIVNDADATAVIPVDHLGRLWANLGTGVFVKIPSKDGSFKIVDAPFRELGKNYPVWAITPALDKNGREIVWFTGREGIIRYDGNLDEKVQGSFNTIVRRITLNEDSVFYTGFTAPAGRSTFSNDWNTVGFQYAAPFFKQENETVFSTYLEGRDKNWSDWTKQSFREFGNLSAGTYTFHVKARNIYDIESPEATFTFIVLAPWYATWWAYALYAILAIGIIYLIVRYRTRHLHENQKKLEETVALRTGELSHRVEELAVINSVQEGLVKEMGIQDIYDLVGEKIRTIFNAQVIDIVTYDPKTNLMEDRYAYEKGDRTLLGARAPQGFRKHVIESKQVQVINEGIQKRMQEFDNKVLLGEQSKSVLFVPLITGGEVRGIISLQDIDKEHAFSDSDVSLLTTLANSMSVALESARRFDETNRLLKETEQRNAELAVINSVQDGLVREMDIQGIYYLVGEKIREIFDAQVIDIVTYDRKTNLIDDKYAYEKGDRTLLEPREPKGFRKYIIETGEQLVINENADEIAKQYDNQVMVGEQPKSLVMVPMITAGQVTGIISLQNVDHDNAFSDSNVRLINTLANSMSIALESARLFDETKRLLKETEQRNAELGVINSVQEGLVREMDIQGIYDLVGEKIREIFNAQVIDIVTYDSKTNLLEDRYSYEKGDRTLVGLRPPQGFRKHVIESRQVKLLNESIQKSMEEFGNKVMVGEESKSAVFVPLITGGDVKGIISLQDLDHEHAFSESDVSLLTTLANSMSVALESARLFDETNRLLKETEQRNAELAVINSVQESLVAQMDMQGIYELVGEKMRNIFNAQVIDIVMYDRNTNLIEDKYSYEKGDRTLVKPRQPRGFRKHVIETGEMLLHNENVEAVSKQFDNEVLIGEMALSQIFFPLIANGKVNGIISLQNLDHEHAFSDSDVSLITTLANSMSVALESARLFDETNRLLKETEQRNAELAVINSVQDGLVREMDIQGIYYLVGEKIREIFDAQVIDIVTYDRKTNRIEDKYSYEKGDRTLVGAREPSGFRKHIIETGEQLVINEDAETIGLKYDNRVMVGEVPKSLVLVPMITSGQVSGIISLQNVDHEHAFSDSNVRLINTLATSMSIALESARLFDETKRLLKETEQRNAELGVINSVQEGLVREMDIQGIYELVGEKIREIFNAQVIDIVTYDRTTNLIEDKYAFEKGDRTLLGPREPKGFRKHVIETGEMLLNNEGVEEASRQYDNEVLIGEMALSQIFFPLMASGKVNGIISLQNLDHEHAFSDSDVSLITTLANSMSVALESARLFDETNRLLKETEQRNAELAVINSVQESLVAQMDMQGIYELVGEKMREIFNAQVIDIVTYDKKTSLIEDRYAYEKGDRTLLGIRAPKGFRKYVIQNGQMLVINKDIEKLRPIYDNTVVVGQAAKSLVLVPMIAGGEVTGVISLQNLDQENAFSESDINLLSTLVNSMSIALKSARLFDETNRLLKETEQRNAELAVINSVQESLVAQMNMQSIYDLVGEKMQEIFNAQVIDIVTYDKKANRIEDRYSYEKGDRTLLASREPGGFRKKVINTGQLLVINKDVERLRLTYDNTVMKGAAAKSLVMVPMIESSEVTGVISLQNLDQEDAFSESDISLLVTLVNSMSVALKSARLFDETNRLLKETEQRKAELAVINNVQEGLVKEFKSKAIYELVGERLCELFDTQTVLIRTFEHETGLETWRYAIEKGQRQFSEPRPMIWANKQLIQTHKPIIINENYLETAKKYGGSGVSIGQPPKSAVFVPMIVGDVVRGSVSLQNVDKEYAFSESELSLLTTLTSSMGVALENARLFDETARLLDETKQRATELSTVNNISQTLASQLNPEDLIKLVGDQLRDLFKANVVYLALLDSATKIIHFPYQFGDDLTPMKLGEGLTSQVLLTGKSLLINKDVDEQTIRLGVQRLGVPAASYLGVPIPVGDDIIGVLSVQSTESENRFNENDERLLSTIAASVGVALRKAQLFEEVNQAKQEAEEASKTAEKANQAKSAFLSTVSHELRTPLTSVLGFAKIIKKRLEEKIFPVTSRDDVKTEKTIQQISENLKVVISEGERLTNLINEVLDLAKIEAGKMEWNMETVSMQEVADRAFSATSSLFDQKNLALKTTVPENLPMVIGDRDKLIQVMVNLISNAVKFTPAGTITCTITRKRNEIITGITDTGIGIAPADHEAVFEQFKQVVGDTLTDKPKGTGLGLPICKEIVEHHGGRIWLESELGKGSTFFFAIPVQKTGTGSGVSKPIHLNDLVKQLKEQMAQSSLNIKGKNATILIVDDDDSIRSLLDQELGDAGYMIEQATNGKEALASIRNHKPDLIILDVMMPEMNGFDVAAILKNDPQTMDIPIIVLSIVQDKARGFRIGVDRYLTKPIDTAQLFTEVGSLLEQGKSKKKVMVVDEDKTAVSTLTDVLQAKGYQVVESDGKEMVEKAILNQPDIIILNSVLSDQHEIVQSLRFEKGLENVLFLIYQ